MQRIAVVGCIGSGKSTAARTLAKQLGLKAFHLDRLWWQPGSYRIVDSSTVADHTIDSTEFRRIEEEIGSGEAWIIDGDAANKDVRLSRADTVLFLDLVEDGCARGAFPAAFPEAYDYPAGCPRQLPMGPVLDTLGLDDVAFEEAPGAAQRHRRTSERRRGHSSADPRAGPLLPRRCREAGIGSPRRGDSARNRGARTLRSSWKLWKLSRSGGRFGRDADVRARAR